MQHLDVHGAFAGRSADGKLVWVIWGTVMKATEGVNLRELDDSIEAVVGRGGFREDARFGDASIMGICGM